MVAVGSEEQQSLLDVKKQFQDLHDTTNDTWKKVENARKIAEISGKLMGAEVYNHPIINTIAIASIYASTSESKLSLLEWWVRQGYDFNASY